MSMCEIFKSYPQFHPCLLKISMSSFERIGSLVGCLHPRRSHLLNAGLAGAGAARGGRPIQGRVAGKMPPVILIRVQSLR